MAVYSTQFIAGAMDPNDIYFLEYTVPTGFVAVVKNATFISGSWGPSNSWLELDAGSLPFALLEPLHLGRYAEWHGRQVITADGVLSAYLQGSSNGVANVSGYLLTA